MAVVRLSGWQLQAARICRTQRVLLPMLAAFLLVSSVTARSLQAETLYKSKFALAEQWIDPQGHTVVVMQGGGDLPGVLTLVLNVGADGAVSGGQWALNVSYVAASHPFAQIDPTRQDPDAALGEKLVQKGVLSGTISAGSTTAANGVVSTINSLQLTITHGTMQFAAVTQGTGTVVGTRMDHRGNASAFTALTF